jgi:tetratricopeptide (TPR) repeat protein
VDTLVRLLTYSALGIVILLANIWFIRLVYASFAAPEFVIAPIQVIKSGKSDEAEAISGAAFAQMLQARLKTLESELAGTERALQRVGDLPRGVVNIPSSTGPLIPVFRFGTVRMPTTLLNAPNFNISVAGVEVGGLIPYIERQLVRRRQLTFTIYSEAEGKQLVAGDIQPLIREGIGQLWLPVTGSYSKAIEDLAHAIIHRRLAEEPRNRVETLTAEEFQTLAQTLIKTAAKNRLAESGRIPDANEFEELFSAVKPLADKVPDWYELSYFAAVVADRANQYDDAIRLYKAVQEADHKHLPETILTLVKTGQLAERINALSALGITLGEELRLARPSLLVNKARARIEADMQFATKHYQELFETDAKGPILVLLETFDNSFWSPTTNAYVTALSAQKVPEETYGMVAQPFIAAYIDINAAGLDAGSISQSFSDVLSSWLKQKKFGQTAQTADWLIGSGEPDSGELPYRSIKAGESLNPRIPFVPYRKLKLKEAGTHEVAGIPNKAFYNVALELGTQTAIEIWRDALKGLQTKNPSIPDFAAATATAAARRAGEPGRQATAEAWRSVGVVEASPGRKD